MSLVAYGSSDESDSNDNEETVPAVAHPAIKLDAKNVEQEKQSFDPANDGGAISDDDEEYTQTASNGDTSIGSLLKGLPAPRGPDQGFINEADELEDEVKPKAAELENAPKPPPKKVRQPVKIAIPALPDSDDEDGEPAKKKRKPAATSGKSGLTALLPAPVHAAKKETNRILLPYSLGKKPKPASSEQTSSSKQTEQSVSNHKAVTLNKNLTQYESDSDDDADDDNTESAGNFFSLNTAQNLTTGGPSLAPTVSYPTDNKRVPTVSLPQTESIQTPTVPLPPGGIRKSLNLPAPQKTDSGALQLDSGQQESEEVNVFGQPIDPNAPLTFKGGVSSQQSYLSQTATASASNAQTDDDGGQNMFYNMPYDGTCSYPEADDDEAFRHDQEFLRLQGKKQRGKEEINILDVNADDYTCPEDLTKHLSEEAPVQRPKKDDQPTHTQKRKHQIQFLAFQAKERELELKNQWSSNKFTKRQTQAKYGF